jgi:hypothetical protein
MTFLLTTVAVLAAITSLGMTLRTVLSAKRQADIDLQTIRDIDFAMGEMKAAADELTAWAASNLAPPHSKPEMLAVERHAVQRDHISVHLKAEQAQPWTYRARSHQVTKMVYTRVQAKANGSTYGDHFGSDLRPAIEHAAKVGRIRVAEVEPLLEWFETQPASMVRDRSPVSRLVEWERVTFIEAIRAGTVPDISGTIAIGSTHDSSETSGDISPWSTGPVVAI